MSTNKTENTSSDNRKIFGPLGKYAIIAVIAASIIVTSVIMLDKQLSATDRQVAAVDHNSREITAQLSTDTETAEVAVANPVSNELQSTTEVAAVNVHTAEQQAADSPLAETLPVTENNTTETVSKASISTEQTSTAETSLGKAADDVTSAQIKPMKPSVINRKQERQARIDSFKLEQKQHMSNTFARIKSLESRQLKQYKTHQDKQIERLRQQIAEQEKLIETLILRNKERLDMRAASMQRKQSNREKILNRI